MVATDIRSELFEIVRQTLFVSDEDVALSDATVAGDVPGWDSLRNIMIIAGVESRFGIRLSAAEIEDLRSLGDLLKLIQQKSGG